MEIDVICLKIPKLIQIDSKSRICTKQRGSKQVAKLNYSFLTITIQVQEHMKSKGIFMTLIHYQQE